ncbi:hypothetical protein FRC98_10695 [Lujinxingia vulgaris]|uniref:Uncharacterized protein n=1 Tax=Lujinxingia vulgaris TaxID=2600176 RepID=A0A5C6XEE5_9DELT|nr:hypothetical protein [Lujinxingia vulgaris]TXD37193.1 hypothetical protein FRC98_10695 [Lujinxingia vulgaris]
MRQHLPLIFALTTATLCAGCDRDNVPAPAEAPAEDLAPRAFVEALPEMLTPSELKDAPAQPPRYDIGALERCPLRYEFIADTSIVAPEEFSPNGRALNLKTSQQGSFIASVEDERWALRAGTIDRFEDVEEERVRHPGIAADALAPILLEVQAQQLIEDDGPTALWSAMGEFPGLTIFFPALPAEATPGSKATWTPRLHQRGSSSEVEARRGKATPPAGYTHPQPQGTTHQAEVRLERWLNLGETRAALLTSEWSTGPYKEYMRSRQGATPEPVHVTIANTDNYAATYVVSEAGRVLFAQVQSTREQHITNTGTMPEQRFLITLTARMNLVEGCDDPVLSSSVESSDEETDEATRAVDRFIAAVKHNDLAALDALISPALREQPGSDVILETLRSHLQKHGPNALGHPELPTDLMALNQGHRVELVGASTHLAGQENNVLVTVYFTERIDGEVRITGLGADTSARAMLWEVMEITEKRFYYEDNP